MKTIIAVLLSLIFLTPSVRADDTQELKSYVENLINEGYKIVSDENLSQPQKYKKSSILIKSNLYLDWMAKYVLGRNRRVISDDKITEFIKIYSDFVVKVYADLSGNYDGEKAILKNVKKVDDNMFIVSMEIERPSGQSAVRVEYLVHKLENKTKNPYLVGDVITEGISILNSQQSEFNSIISSQGIDVLIMDLKKRLEGANSPTPEE
jgi:phospholipid transport system substrate-binding protein